ncbi:GlsB/YeaQ/YmgE family stress response membrane protein [Rhizobiaceae bacterium]|nr:GlsB/YeaQ/YmgE family stress response membrane protein [Rhizobiaceae bacterium]
MGWILTIIIGGLAGFIAEKLMKADMGILMNIVIGIVGALLLNAILSAVGIVTANTILIQCVVAIIGACLLIAIYRLVRGRSVR